MRKADTPQKIRPALSPKAEENQLIALATDLAMKQLQDGTASSQTINHFLKLASPKERLEQEILEKQAKLISAKIAALESQQRQESLYEEALQAFKSYQPSNDFDDY